jgi:hypothetical protein
VPQYQSSVPSLFLALLHQRLDVKLDSIFFWILSSFLRWLCFYFAFAMFLYFLLLLFLYFSCLLHLYLIFLFPSLTTSTFVSKHLATHTAPCPRRSWLCRLSFTVHCIPAFTPVLSKHLSRLSCHIRFRFISYTFSSGALSVPFGKLSWGLTTVTFSHSDAWLTEVTGCWRELYDQELNDWSN